MKEKVRVSFDVPLEEHTYIKTECARSRIVFRELMKEIFHKTYEEMKKKKELHDQLLQGFMDSYEGKGRIITEKELKEWDKQAEQND